MTTISLKTAFRSLKKNRSFALINIAGLGVGIAAAILLFLVIRYEETYDNYHANNDRIYRVVTEKKNATTGAIDEYHRGVPNPMVDALRNDFPAFEKVGFIASLGQAQIYVPGSNGLADEKRFKENEGLFFAESGVFEIFDYQWVAGNATGLTAPNTGVLSETLAKKYFGSAQAAIGRTIEFWSFRNKVLIQGVFKDLPGNTDIPVQLGVSLATLRKIMDPTWFTAADNWNWVNERMQCFVLLPRNHSINTEAAQLPAFMKKYAPVAKPGQASSQLRFQPLHDIHFNASYGSFREDGLSRREVWSLGLIGVFLLLVACINFINLSTAQSVLRAKEIGVRKVLGSDRGSLISQFLQETGVITFFALLLGMLLAVACLPILNNLLNKTFSVGLLLHPAVLLFLVALTLVITLLAGLYPAFIVSGFKPAAIFRNKLSSKIGGGISLRRSLVVFQFVIAQLLVIGTIVVVKQMQFFRNQSMGLVKEGIALIDLPSDSSLRVKYPLLKQQMQALPGVKEASLCWDSPVAYWSAEEELYFNNDAEKLPFRITIQFGDTSFYSTFGLQLAAGRLPFQSDSVREVVVNETAVKQLGLAAADAAIGKTLSFDGKTRYPIVGVVRDYNSRSLHMAVKPIAITTNLGYYSTLAVRVNTASFGPTMEKVERLFRNIYPTYLYDLTFLDDKINGMYKSEATTAQLFKVFAVLAIFISCLGLYGLVAFMAVQKTKEIGIRKVLGASVQSIVLLFSKEFTVLIVVAFLIAGPVAYYFMNEWLADFHYHTTMGAGIFLLAIVFSMLIAWIAVGYKAIRAALVNPVKSLKTE
ncbi:ABC transporter permease [Paraflavitalea sp. CAU 1676]|uniref:ABC transporter permease n=1 Tax=Paraflavitalea sp. CAU 1676 TaxID=3032598 RepID=UPI0023DA8AD5|nr:ABC transporter permease [Paraflavitalea sp. CAU 1676]MDF2189908.1 ABC transporter permease [Paraflavitalea sp. CAU 1676]